MTRILVLSIVIAASGAVAQASAPADTQPAVSGTIVVPAGAARAQRCFAGAGGQNGVFGWVLNVTGGAPFTLTTPDPTIDDVNIGFYSSLTPCEAPAAVVGSHTNSFGNESGTVPASATRAIVYVGSLPAPGEHAGHGRPNTPFTFL